MKSTYCSELPSLKKKKFIENFFKNENLKSFVKLSKKTSSKSNYCR